MTPFLTTLFDAQVNLFVAEYQHKEIFSYF